MSKSEGGAIASLSPLSILARGASHSLIVRVSGVALTLVTHLLLAREMSQTDYGVWAWVTTFMATLAVIAALGFSETSVRFIAEYSAGGHWSHCRGFVRFASGSVLIASATLVAIVLGLLALMPFLLDDPLRDGVLWGIMLLPAFALLAYRQAVLRGFRKIASSQFFEQVMIPSLLIGFALAYFSSERTLDFRLLLLMHSAIAFLAVGLVWWTSQRSVPDPVDRPPELTHWKPWMSVSLPLMMASFSSVALTRAGVLVLGAMSSSAAVALYMVALKLSTLLNFGLSAVNSILAPLIAEYFHKRDRDTLQRVVTVAMRWTFLSTIPLAAGLIVFGKIILRLFGESYEKAYPVLVVLTIAEVVNVFAGSVGPLLKMTGEERFYLRVLLSTGIGTVALTPVGILLADIEGAAIVALASSIAWNAILAIGVYRRTGLRSWFTPGPLTLRG